MPTILARALDRLRRARGQGADRRWSADHVPAAALAGQLVPAVRREGGTIGLKVDDVPVQAFAGESVLAAVLRHGRVLRRLEFDGAPRAGFCLMGACQDCWIWADEDRRVRACTTLVVEGMVIRTESPDGEPSRG